jgi:hypothetical protein
MWSSGGPANLTEHELVRAAEVMMLHASEARMLPAPKELDRVDIELPFVFVPLQRPGDSVVKYDSSVRDFGALLRKTLLLAKGSLFVVCKTHPLDMELDLGVPDRIAGGHTIIRHSFGGANDDVCNYLLSKASVVVGINSNMLFRGLLCGVPVIATGRGWFSGSGALYEVDGLKGLTGLRVPPPDLEAQRRYIATCLSRQLTFRELRDPSALQEMLRRVGIELYQEAASA